MADAYTLAQIAETQKEILKLLTTMKWPVLLIYGFMIGYFIVPAIIDILSALTVILIDIFKGEEQ